MSVMHINNPFTLHGAQAAAQAQSDALLALERIKTERPREGKVEKTEKTEEATTTTTTTINFKEAKPIASFDRSTEKLPGYDRAKGANLRQLLPEFLNRKKEDFKAVALGRPAVMGKHFVVATDDVTCKENFVTIINWEAMSDSTKNPIVASFSPMKNEFVRDIMWVTPNLMIGACGEGAIQLFKSTATDPLNFTPTHRDHFFHTKPIREMAFHPHNKTHIVTGGYDKNLQYLRLTDSGITGVGGMEHNNVITAINWSANSANSISMNSDEGGFYMFDARTQLCDKASFYLQAAKDECFTHEVYTENHFMLGFGDGEIQHYDMRSPKKMLHRVNDPYVLDGIGDLIFDHKSQSFLATGFTDFSVWRMDPKTQEAKIWSHCGPNTSAMSNRDGFQCSGAYLDLAEKPTVAIADSQGVVQLYTQNFADS